VVRIAVSKSCSMPIASASLPWSLQPKPVIVGRELVGQQANTFLEVRGRSDSGLQNKTEPIAYGSAGHWPSL